MLSWHDAWNVNLADQLETKIQTTGGLKELDSAIKKDQNLR